MMTDDEQEIARRKWPHPIGCLVIYFPTKGSFEDAQILTTRSGPWIVGMGQVLVALEGKSGGHSVEHLVPIATLEHAFSRLIQMRDETIKRLETDKGRFESEAFNANEELRHVRAELEALKLQLHNANARGYGGTEEAR